MDPTESQPLRHRHVVAMPWPGRGHINPMMNLCKRLVLRDPNLIVTFVVTEEWLGLIGPDPKPDRIHFATLPNLIPSELVRANDFIGFVNAVHATLEEPFEKLLDRLSSPPPTVIVADTYVLWAVRVGERRNVPVVSLWTMSATIISFFLHSDLLVSHGHALSEPSGPALFFVKQLGEGSFGSVSLYQGLGYDGTVASVAVKTSDRQHAESLLREVQILSEFKGCTRIVQCYDTRVKAELNRFNGCVEYKIPLEYAPGGSLSDFINKFKDDKLPDPMIRDFTRMLLEGLATIHAHGYVHCDLKPENILVFPSHVNNNGVWRSSFELKISDFGLSRREGDSSWWSPSRPFAGTSIYMSPNSVSYGETEKDLDLWSLGCCVLEMYTGKRPWWHKNYEADDLMMDKEPLIPSDLPLEAKLFILTCFARRSKDASRLLRHVFVGGDDRKKNTQPSHVSDKIDLQLANFIRNNNVSKTQSIRVPPAAQVMPHKTIMA